MMTPELPIKILGMGRYLPRTQVLSTKLDEKLGLPKGSVEQKSGLFSRYFAAPDETSSYMASRAAIDAIGHANVPLASIDLIIAACGVGEQLLPCTAALVQRQLGLEHSGIACFDVNSTCLSFITALDIAAHLLTHQRFNRALIVSSERPSVGLNWSDLESSTIFGDGAAACIVEKSNDHGRILAFHMETNSIGADYCRVEAGGTSYPPASDYDKTLGLFKMDGKKVFKLASQMVGDMQQALLRKANIGLGEIDWVVPHQASQLAMNHIRKRLGIAPAKFVDIFKSHGNQMAASVPTVLHHLIHQQNIKRGQRIYLLGTGAGISAAGMILEY